MKYSFMLVQPPVHAIFLLPSVCSLTVIESTCKSAVKTVHVLSPELTREFARVSFNFP